MIIIPIIEKMDMIKYLLGLLLSNTRFRIIIKIIKDAEIKDSINHIVLNSAIDAFKTIKIPKVIKSKRYLIIQNIT